MSEKPLVPYKSLKQKQKVRIADWMYRETLRFFLEHQRMPEKNLNCCVKLFTPKYGSVIIGLPMRKSNIFTPDGWIPMPCASSGMPKQGLLWNLSPSSQSRRKPAKLPVRGKRKSVNPLQRNPARMIVSSLSLDIPLAVRPMVLHGRKWDWNLGRTSHYK